MGTVVPIWALVLGTGGTGAQKWATWCPKNSYGHQPNLVTSGAATGSASGDVHALPCPGPYSGLVVSSEVGEGDARDGELTSPSALALVPSLGLVVRELGGGGRVHFFGTPDAIAMASMSCCRVGWFVAVARGTLRR